MNKIVLRWKSGRRGKFFIVLTALIAMCSACTLSLSVLQSIGSATRPAAPSASSKSGSVFIAPTFPPPATATIAPTEIAPPTETAPDLAPPQPTDTVVAATAVPEPDPTATLSLEDSTKQIARNVCKERFREATVSEGMLVICQLQDSFTQEWIVQGVVQDFKNITTAAYAANPSLEYVTVQFVAMFQDAEGNESEKPAFTLRMRRTQFDRINWSNMGTKNLARLLSLNSEESSVGMPFAMREMWAAFINED